MKWPAHLPLVRGGDVSQCYDIGNAINVATLNFEYSLSTLHTLRPIGEVRTLCAKVRTRSQSKHQRL